MIRVRRSHLEAFRNITRSEWGDESELIAAIKGEGSSNWRMDAGTAWHNAIERGILSSHGFSFNEEDANMARGILGIGRWEVPGSKVYQLDDGEEIEVTAQADHIRGLVIQDNKTKFSQANPQDYEGALQWRIYLDVHECDIFTYHLWSFADPDENGWCKFRGHLSFSYNRYPGMEEEIKEWLYEFKEWAKFKGVAQYLEGAMA